MENQEKFKSMIFENLSKKYKDEKNLLYITYYIEGMIIRLKNDIKHIRNKNGIPQTIIYVMIEFLENEKEYIYNKYIENEDLKKKMFNSDDVIL